MHVLDEAERLIESFVESFDPALYTGGDAERLVACFGRLERLVGAGKVLAARQVTATGAWKAGGYASKEEWYSKQTNTTLSNAAQELATAVRLSELPETEAALRSGELTSEQAAAVSSAARADPSSERRLLGDASARSLSGLRKACQAVRHAARGATSADREVIHAGRYCQHWTDEAGAFMLRARMTPEDGATLLASLEPHRREVFKTAGAAGARDRSDGYEADALVEMARASRTRDGAGATGPVAVVNLRVDYTAHLRGYTLPGEICEIDGVGPVPVATARRLATDAVIRAVAVVDGRAVDVRTVGRSIPANLRRTVIERDRRCAAPGCERTRGLELHHLVWVKVGGVTSLDNLARVCSFHHDLITYKGAYLGGSFPNWRWYPPGSKPAEVRGWYDPAPDEVLDDLGIDRHTPPVERAQPDPPAPGPGPPPDQLF
jgi:hypothetical protein